MIEIKKEEEERKRKATIPSTTFDFPSFAANAEVGEE